MPNIGPLELIIVLAIVLLIFGPKRLPGLGRQLGRGMREFKDSVTGKDHDAEERDALPAAPVADPVATDPVRPADPVDEQPPARAFGERRED
jgi:sec-independent protein translocase protein TatA